MSAMFPEKVLKPSKRLRVYTEGNADLISNLPECLLVNIFSFLPMRDLIRTSVLSKGWRYLWTQAPNLDFDQSLFENCLCYDWLCQCHESKMGKFVEFLDRMLMFVDGRTISKFRLSFYYHKHFRYTESIDRWVHLAMTSKAHELILDFSKGYSLAFLRNVALYQMPHHPIAPTWLTVLKLHLCKFNLSSFEALSSLRSLFLRFVLVLDGSIGVLITKCPLLQDLSLKTCYFPDQFMNHPLDLKLKTLTIKNCYINEVMDTQVAGVRWTEDFSHKPIRSIHISAPNLLSFKFCGKHIWELSLKRMSHLVDAKIINDQTTIFPGQSQILHKLLKELDHAQALTLCSWFLQVLPLEGNQQSLETPLNNLKHLKLKVGLHTLEFLGIACLLRSSPNLESLTLITGKFAHIWEYDLDIEVLNELFDFNERLYWESQMWCFNCLKKIEIHEFFGTKFLMDMIKFVLKNSAVLESVVICFDERISSLTDPEYQDMSRLQFEINSFHRASSCAKILFL
ncbi:putative F-box/LRR-repeat protein At5g54820 [Telopea speciosissima]|uniref:putative F-box/LRR-repeat protein At5g54820 n=1 Tax=Telopea speciosissima TaxID=54955 RepID=UPI001CC81E70|nr:putative F-box/LRR-repeat protein At5g54820 [Telopea speciosissima]